MSSLPGLTINLLSIHSLQIFSPTPEVSFHLVATDSVALILVFLILSVVCPAQPATLNLRPSFLSIYPKFQHVFLPLLLSSRFNFHHDSFL